jgi:hypothetical protein
VSLGETIVAVTTAEELYELLDPDVMWYSTDVNSNYTRNAAEDAVACIERNLGAGLTGRFELLGEREDAVVVRPSFDPPRPASELCLLIRAREGLIVELRDFASSDAALRYAGIL